ncbi:nucleoside-diphosphate-sugar epimerase [Sinobacterium caligoides]|uniref:Nucleoside-diphosphate-sugar epimerase n=1 Tax=Sinobacterium caligoides TaxID=933926 RepID=A0A3N2DQ83_9GAMM|nr:NAD-dependent epimerase/dehydratase family protein [Sinobacterium caligoides]ROS01842.1 nucleoside-diphosphate-sugar epimerase [Sinobacterium caligoides]
MRALIIGAGGFIGTALCRKMHENDKDFVAHYRTRKGGVSNCIIGSISILEGSFDWANMLGQVGCVIYCAGNNGATPSLCHQANVVDPLALTRKAIECGVDRFIYLSSAKVFGDVSQSLAFSVRVNNLSPVEEYAQSKVDAERALMAAVAGTSMELVIIRPPMVYGAGSKGGVTALANIAKKGIPLPFASVNNRRSVIHVDRLCDFIVHCINHPRAAEQPWLVSDGVDRSLPELIRHISQPSKPRLLPFPPSLLNKVLCLMGKKRRADSLFADFQIDIQDTVDILGWDPLSVDCGGF